MNMLALMILFEGRGLLYREYYLGENCHHRRTGIFLPGGAVNHLPKKISQVAQIFTKESEREEGRITTT